MSAFICSKLHIQTIAFNYVRHIEPNNFSSDRVLQVSNILYKENITSVNHRYREKTKTSGWKKLDKKIEPISLMQLYKLVQCLDYQSCEHLLWQTSDAYKMIKELEAKIVPELEEYFGVKEEEFYRLYSYNIAEWSI